MSTPSLFVTDDGSHSVYSPSGVSYHSRHGAIQESRHVFIEAALLYLSQRQRSIDILEIGFGTGLNAFLSFLEGEARGLQLNYHSYELFPLAEEAWRALNYPEQAGAAERRRVFEALHLAPWGNPFSISPAFSLTKHQDSFLNISAEQAFDAIYFDPFAPNDQPEFWTPEFLEKMHRALRPGGVLTTYCAKGYVKRNLRAVGFQVEKLPGPPGKREMTRASVEVA